jgi:hypothetical protein
VFSIVDTTSLLGLKAPPLLGFRDDIPIGATGSWECPGDSNGEAVPDLDADIWMATWASRTSHENGRAVKSRKVEARSKTRQPID